MAGIPEINVRVAAPGDFHAIMGVAMMACQENAFLDWSPEQLAKEIWPAVHRDHGICGVVGELGGQIEGVVVLRIGKMWYSPTAIIEEKAVFVHPDFRSAKGGRARRLTQFSKYVSDRLEMPLIIGVLSDERTAGKIRMYEREFGPPSGAFFLYRAKTGAAKEAA